MAARVLAVLVAVISLLVWVSAIPTISAVGSKFFTSDGDQFYVKGIAYQLTPEDPLIDTNQCQMDARLMKELGANAIRVYHVDPDGDHTGCMKAFEDAGIYLFVDLDTFDTMILPTAPQWNETQLRAFEAVLDEFVTFDNTAGVFVGNEVLTRANESAAAPYVLAAARDVKLYRDEKKYRKVPVGYSAADIAELRPMLQNYFECRPDAAERLDFFALNAYEWCGSDTSYTVSGYSQLQSQAEGYPVPIYFSETGCNTVRPRTFEDQTAIFGSDMADTWSGAIVYEWIEEMNNYGLISYGPKVEPTATASDVMDGFTRRGSPTPISPDFENLKSQWATLTPSGIPLSSYTETSLPLPDCPEATPTGWEINPNAALPELGASGAAAVGVGGESSASVTPTGSAASGTPTPDAALKLSNPFSALVAEGYVLSGSVAALMLLGGVYICWL